LDSGRIHRPVVARLCGCARDSATATDGKATVVRVIDGDTIVVHIGGRDENVENFGDRHT
jgi:endonuclease YncB( thermonuclease family)